MEGVGKRSTVFIDLSEVGNNCANPKLFETSLHDHAVPVEYGPACVLGRRVVSVDVKANEIVEFETLFFPQ